MRKLQPPPADDGAQCRWMSPVGGPVPVPAPAVEAIPDWRTARLVRFVIGLAGLRGGADDPVTVPELSVIAWASAMLSFGRAAVGVGESTSPPVGSCVLCSDLEAAWVSRRAINEMHCVHAKGYRDHPIARCHPFAAPAYTHCDGALG